MSVELYGYMFDKKLAMVLIQGMCGIADVR